LLQSGRENGSAQSGRLGFVPFSQKLIERSFLSAESVSFGWTKIPGLFAGFCVMSRWGRCKIEKTKKGM
jgi:hypothetical protein